MTGSKLTIPNVGGNVVLLTQLYWPLVHPALQEPRRVSVTSSRVETHPRWWVELCARHGQEAWDPDAFWPWQADELRRLVADAKAEFGDAPVEVEVPEWV